jgi:hypothetical protein
VLGLVEVIATLARKRKALEITPLDFDAKVAEIVALRSADAVHFAALL